jgi:hypothetical protein
VTDLDPDWEMESAKGPDLRRQDLSHCVVTDWDSVKDSVKETVMDSEMATARGQSHVVSHDLDAVSHGLCVVNHGHLDVVGSQRYLCGPHHVVSHGHHDVVANQRYHQEFQTDWEMVTVMDWEMVTVRGQRRWDSSHGHLDVVANRRYHQEFQTDWEMVTVRGQRR